MSESRLATLPSLKPDHLIKAAHAAAGVAACLLVLPSLVLRWVDLDHIPGLNGDEAWLGTQARAFLLGETCLWTTPTGNPLNPFLFFPEVVLHAWFEPSVYLLRIPAVASGLFAVACAWFLCRRVFDRPTALAFTLILAILPINVAYSRFAWDSCQSLLATIPLVLLPLMAHKRPNLRGRLTLAAALVAGVALLVHPTNLFVLPVPLITLIVVWSAELRRWIDPRAGRLRAVVLAACTILLLAGLAAVARPRLAAGLARLAQPGDLAAFALHYVRLFSGVTVFRFISGSHGSVPGAGILRTEWNPCDVAAACVLCGLLFIAVSRAREQKQTADLCLAAGWAAGLAAFYWIAGPRAIAPHFERYGVCLIAPAVLLAARAISQLRAQAGWFGATVSWAFLAVGAVSLADFQLNYLDHFRLTGGTSHPTFQTASVDPKVLAVEIVRRQAAGEPAAWIATDDWWILWTARYLTADDEQIHVEPWTHLNNPGRTGPPPDPRRTWRLSLAADVPSARHPADPVQGFARPSWSITDFTGRPAVVISGPGIPVAGPPR